MIRSSITQRNAKHNGRQIETQTRYQVRTSDRDSLGFEKLEDRNLLTTAWHVGPGDDLQAVLDSAIRGGEIILAPGTYYGNFEVRKDTRDLAITAGGSGVVLDGQENGTVLEIVDARDIRIEGLTIQGGDGPGNDGGGLAIKDSTVYVLGSTITDNRSLRTAGGVSAIGDKTFLGLVGNTIVDNRARGVGQGASGGYGGAVLVSDGASALIADNLIDSNYTWNRGTIYVAPLADAQFGDPGEVTIFNNVISNNTADRRSAGIYVVSASNVTIERNLIHRNRTTVTENAAIYLSNSTATVHNNTVSDNSVNRDLDETGILVTADSNVSLTNNIVSFNQDVGIDAPATAVAQYNIVWGQPTAYMGGVTPDGNSLEVDPEFINRTQPPYDYGLMATSPGVNSGHPDPEFDDEDGSQNDRGFEGGPDRTNPEIGIRDFARTSLVDGQTVHSMGTIAAGFEVPSHWFTVVNEGYEPLMVSSIQVPTGFVLSDDVTGETIERLRSRTFGLTFDTAVVGALSGPVQVDSNATQIPTFTFDVTATVTQPGTLPQQFLDKAREYASATVRYFTSGKANNELVGFTHSWFGQGFGLKMGQEFVLTPNDGSHVVINEVTLAFNSLALAYKEDWLDFVPAAEQLDKSWGFIREGLLTLRSLQTSGDPARYDPNGVFHRSYFTNFGTDSDTPREDIRRDPMLNEQSSDDSALPYLNLLVLRKLVEDPLVDIPQEMREEISDLISSVLRDINLRHFLQGNRIVLNYVDGVASSQAWDRLSAEGVPILSALLLSGQISMDEFSGILGNLENHPLFWPTTNHGNVPVLVPGFHSAQFMHSLRAIHGLPVTSNEAPGVTFFASSTKPTAEIQIDYALDNAFKALGTQPMTQSLFGERLTLAEGSSELARFPGNEGGETSLSKATATHGLFAALARYPQLQQADIDRLIGWIADYEVDFFHNGNVGDEIETQLGFEAVIPFFPEDMDEDHVWRDSNDNLSYADGGHQPYDALNAAYTLSMIFDILNQSSPLSMWNAESVRLAQLMAFIDSGVPLSEEYFNLDFGDAPDPLFPTQFINNGARHQIVAGGPHLGTSVTSETNAQKLDVDDGVIFTGLRQRGLATANIRHSGSGRVNLWIDFNNNGSWDDPGEHVINDVQLIGAGVTPLQFAVPGTADTGVNARVRFSTQTNLGYDGYAVDGEVEDYVLDILPQDSTIGIGAVNFGIAADDQASGTGYILFSQENVYARFASNPPWPGNSEHLIAVRYSGGQWQYDDNLGWHTFTPTGSDRLLAGVDFSNDTIQSLQGPGGKINGIQQGFVNSDLTFTANQWKGVANPGEFTVAGTYFQIGLETEATNIGTVGSGVAVDDNATGTGYILYSQQNVHERFASSPLAGNSDHLIAVRYLNGQWQFNNNSFWIAFAPTTDDRILAVVDFTNDTIQGLQGVTGDVSGVQQGFANSDLTFTVNQWNGTANPGEFTVAGTFFQVDYQNSIFDIGPINFGIAVDDDATGTGYILFSQENLYTRFGSNPPYTDNSEHMIAVRFTGGLWQYNNNHFSSSWHTFTPTASDRLLAVVDFTSDTIQGLQGATGQVDGIQQGFLYGDLTFTANQWNAMANLGEFTVTGTFFQTGPENLIINIGPVNSGIAVDDDATGAGYILYSHQNVYTRFDSRPPLEGNSEHLIAVRHSGGQWQYNHNQGWRVFLPATDDRLLATVDFTNDTIQSLHGATGTVNGIQQGFLNGDLTFVANQWNGMANNGEFTVAGTFFQVNLETVTFNIGPVNAGIAVDDDATGAGYILFSQQNLNTRFASNPPYGGNSDHLIAVRYSSGQWQYNNNHFSASWHAFTPVASDRLLARVDFTNDTIQSLQGASGQVNGIYQGFLNSNLTFIANQWNGTANAGEFTVSGTFFQVNLENTITGIGPVNSGIAVDDNATGAGYILFSHQNLNARFTSNPPWEGNSVHLIAVRYSGGQWQYNDNLAWRVFIPSNDDRLLVSVDFTNDTIQSLQGATGQINGIRQGFLHSDLVFIGNQWNGTSNLGEFTIEGTFFA